VETQDEATAVARALAAAIHTFGPEVSTTPRRVQGCLSDELGSMGRSRRAEVDAVVIGAEEGVPASILDGSFHRPAAMARLQERGLTVDAATYSLDVWEHGLGTVESADEVPTMRDTSDRPPEVVQELPVVVEGTDLDGLPSAPSQPAAIEAAMPPLPPAIPAPAVAAVAAGEIISSGAAPEGSRRRKTGLIATAAIASCLVVALVLYLTLGSSSTNVDTASSARKMMSSTTMHGSGMDKAVMVKFPATAEHDTQLTRLWHGNNTGVHAELLFKNTTAAEQDFDHVEALPKDMVASTDKITSGTPFTTLAADPVISWPVKLGPGQHLQITYEVTTTAKPTHQLLTTWKSEQPSTLTAYQASVTTTTPLLPGPVVVVPPAGSNTTTTVTLLPPHGSKTNTTVTCWNGTKAKSLAACPAQPPPQQPLVTCWNGSKAASLAACPAQPPPLVTCWNGSKAASLAACPAKPPPDPTFDFHGPTCVALGSSGTYTSYNLANVTKIVWTSAKNYVGNSITINFSGGAGTTNVVAEAYGAAGSTPSIKHLTVTVYDPVAQIKPC
jgi:hypothetical protein